MAGAERATRVDDPLVRALDGASVDTTTPWFIRQARTISPAETVLPTRPPGLRSVSAGLDASISDEAAPPQASARVDDRPGPIGRSSTPIPTAAAPPVALAPLAGGRSRLGSMTVLILVFVGAVTAGWLLRGITPTRQPIVAPPASSQPMSREVSPMVSKDRGVTSTKPVSDRPLRARADDAVAVPAAPLTSEAKPRVDALSEASRSDRAAAVVVVPPTARLRVPRVRVAPVAACSGLGRRGAWLVCTRPQLAALDRRLARMSAQTLATGDPRALRRLAKSSARFTARRDRCTTASCIARLYERRLDAVSDYLRDGIKAAAKREARRAGSRSR